MTKISFLAQNPSENGAEFFSERWTICCGKVRPKKKIGQIPSLRCRLSVPLAFSTIRSKALLRLGSNVPRRFGRRSAFTFPDRLHYRS